MTSRVVVCLEYGDGANARLRMFINVCEMFRIGTFYQSMGSYPIEVLIRLYIRLDYVRKNSYLQYTIYTQSCRLVYIRRVWLNHTLLHVSLKVSHYLCMELVD